MCKTGFLTRVSAALLLAGLSACGGGGGVTPPDNPPVTMPATPAATITGVGAGALVLHPSLDPRFFYALETPIRITETAGGTADWNFARISIFRSGTEIERYELGANVIAAAGFSRIAARSDDVYSIAFRQNSDNFDRVDITLGFGDLKDARQFSVAVPFNSFSDVTLSTTPIVIPPDGTVRRAGK